MICVYVLPGSRKASRKSHHEFNEKRQISRVQCWPGPDPHLRPVGWLAGRLPDPASAIIVCKKFMHVAIAYIKKWCSKSSGALPTSPTTVFPQWGQKIAFRLNFRHKTPNCTIKKFVAHH